MVRNSGEVARLKKVNSECRTATILSVRTNGKVLRRKVWYKTDGTKDFGSGWRTWYKMKKGTHLDDLVIALKHEGFIPIKRGG